MNVIGEVLTICIDFMKACEIPIIGFGSISLWELFWGFTVLGVFIGCINAMMDS